MTKRIVASLLLVVGLFSLLTFTTVAWISNLLTYFATTVGGSADTGYFADGDGSPEDPYILTNSTHVYNLAWLQYMGLLNNTYNADGTLYQYHFKIADSVTVIDMQDVVIPPIGTTEYPFIGNFDGNGKTIRNATISNYLGTSSSTDDTAIVKRPLSVTEMGQTANIVGFFGVIGAMDDALAALLPEVQKDAEGNPIVVNTVTNLYLDTITIRSETDESLMGLLAGYINSTVLDVGVYNGTISVGEGTKPLTAVEVSAALNAISLYSLVGAYDMTHVIWEELPSQANDGVGNLGEAGQGFGGSMDMNELIQRLTYMYTENVIQKNNYPAMVYYGGTRATDQTKFTYRADYTYTTAALSNLTTYLGEGTVLPLNVKTDILFAGNDITVSSGSFDFLTREYYRTHSSEPPSSNNTGYIVSGGEPNLAWIRSRIQAITGTSGGIKNSLTSGTVITGTNAKDTNLKIYTVDYNGTNHVVDPNNHSFKQFDKVIENFISSQQNSAAPSMISGIRFFSTESNAYSPRGINIDANGNVISGTTTADVELYGNSVSGYEMINGAINFNLKGAGYITAIAGTYYSSSAEHSLFSLYQVHRTDGRITSATKINSIWAKYVNGELKGIEYNKTNETASAGFDCVFDTTGTNSLTTNSAAYYFEIPVLPGDYALGGAVGETNGAYLMYLDIGANGDINLGGGSESTTPTIQHTISGVNFLDQAGFTALGTESAEDDYDMITARLTSDGTDAHTGVDVNYTRSGNNTLHVTRTGDSKLTLLFHSDNASLLASAAATETAMAVRRREDDELL